MKTLIPWRVREYFKRRRETKSRRYCPVCNTPCESFLDHGRPPRPQARCPTCNAVERHRLIWSYFQRKTDLFDRRPKQVLHVAPEPWFEPRLRAKLAEGYVTADLLDPRAMVKMDITDIQYPDESFDVIYCSHVLEHVPDDRRAMREFYRVLKPDGWAVLMVPITVESTFEDPSVTDPQERLRLFGQEDHVRRYGPDYVDRLREAGFEVTIEPAESFLTAREIERFVVRGEVYYCQK